jgi:hypothetical protein
MLSPGRVESWPWTRRLRSRSDTSRPRRRGEKERTFATEGDEPQGIQLPVDAKGKRSSARFGHSAIAVALGVMDADTAAACIGERDSRDRYPQHVHRLVSLQAASLQHVVASCQAGLDALWSTLEFVREGKPMGLRNAMAAPVSPAPPSIELRGRGASAAAPW